MITLPTTDHGDVTLSEPGWCTGHANHIPGYRVDLTHTGTVHDLTFEGATILDAMFSQFPHSTDPEGRPDPARCRTGLYIAQVGYSATLNPAEVRQFAATLTVHAMHLRTLADQLEAIRAREAGQ
ncbi:DUF6907 domain-containing protein [Streptomyces sp. NPDC057677]|uniref:DUF6907 domain-containing protein n=1 Tax=unclassified Streptomyces TaxID=2593676 RepID=UPI00368B3390